MKYFIQQRSLLLFCLTTTIALTTQSALLADSLWAQAPLPQETAPAPESSPPPLPQESAPALESSPSPSPAQATPTPPPIVLGQSDNQRYGVVVPAAQPESVLERVRQVADSAFASRSRLGGYVHAGAFASRSEAEALSDQLRASGLDARVVYFR